MESKRTSLAILRASPVLITTSDTSGKGGNTPLCRVTDGRYHGVEDNPYPLPNDEEEVERLDNLQFVCSSFVGGNVVAPISRKPTNICNSFLLSVRVSDC